MLCPIRPRHKKLVVEPMDDEALSSIIEVVQFDNASVALSYGPRE